MIAYLDPASGSMILSVVAGGLAGIVVFFKSFGHRIMAAIGLGKKDEPTVDDVEPTDPSAPVADETAASS